MKTIPRRVRVTLDIDTVEVFNQVQARGQEAIGRDALNILLSGGDVDLIDTARLMMIGVEVVARIERDKHPKVHHLGAALQGIACEHADRLTPRQIEALYEAAKQLWVTE